MVGKLFLLLIAGLIMSQSYVSSGVPDTARVTNLLRCIYHRINAPSAELTAATASTLLSAERETIVIVHGYGETVDKYDDSANSILNAFLDRDEFLMRNGKTDPSFDIIVVDWAILSTSSYSNAVLGVQIIANYLAELLNGLMDNGGVVVASKLHLVGFDLGAHIVGTTGRNLKEKPARITGLDPNGEGFKPNPIRLSRNDALYVEVIHTDAIGVRAIGIGEAIGTADYFPNGGTRQPGCVVANNQCHHRRAFQLFDASVAFVPNNLIGNECSLWTDVTGNRCRGVTQALGDIQLIKRRLGMFRVNTGATYPYAL